MGLIVFLLCVLVLLTLLYLLCLYPGKRRSIAPFDTRLIAHRGLHTETSEAPENTMAAFQRAKAAGYGVELDIQFTADRQIVVFHDADLKRMCGVDARVDALTYEELCAYTVQGSDQHIPLFSEVLTLLGDTPIVCELKSHGSNTDMRLCEAACPLIVAYAGPICVESFNPLMVRWFYKHHPEIRRGFLTQRYKNNIGFWLGMVLAGLLPNVLIRPDFIALRHTDRRLPGFRLCRRLYRPWAIAWTVCSQKEQDAALKHFDNVIFEQYIPKGCQTPKEDALCNR